MEFSFVFYLNYEDSESGGMFFKRKWKKIRLQRVRKQERESENNKEKTGGNITGTQ